MDGLISVLPLLMRRRAAVADVLPVVAFAAATAVIATVLGGTLAFVDRAADVPPDILNSPRASAEQTLLAVLPVFAGIACVLLLPPAVSFGGAAGRLSLARREQDLATMRLIGATTSQVSLVALLDVAGQALIGAVIGLGVHLVLAPPLTTLDFGIDPFTAAELRLPWLALPLVAVGLALLAVASAAIALQGVAISPLGVARQSRVVRMSILRLLLFVAIAGLLAVATSPMSPLRAADQAIAVIVALTMIAVVLLMINVVGPFIVWILALITARAAPTPALMVASRRLAADPRAGWRSISVLTIALVVAGVLSLLASLGDASNPSEAGLLTALGTGGMLTLAIAALLGAVSTGVMQAARVIDQAPVLRSQHVAGATIRQLQSTRLLEVILPLLLSSIVAAFTAFIVALPMLSGDTLTPAVLLRFIISVLLAYAMVLGAVAVSSPLVAQAARGAAGRRIVEA